MDTNTRTAPATVGARLAAMARRFPHNVAVAEKDISVTYERFDLAATAIAGHILDAAQGRPGPVVLFFENKLPAIAAMCGAARAGRAYAALDAADPEERLRFIFEDCAPVAVLTETSLVERVSALVPAGCAVVDVQRLPRTLAAHALPDVSPDALLYLFYTSGSTGRPKGVTQTHANLIHFADAYGDALAVEPGDRLSLLFTLSFAASLMDIYPALLRGATVCAYDTRNNGIVGLADWLDRARITVFHGVPTIFRELCKRMVAGRLLPHLRVVDLSGEPLFASDAALFKAHTAHQCVLVNQLASTEVGIISQYRVTHASTPPQGSMIPVGRCLPGVRASIRRKDGSAADTDEIGEIVISTPYASPGYWKRPDLDAEIFSAAAEPGWRNCVNGDVGHMDAEGNLYFVGRIGNRVKIRGHTVDLAEVDAALLSCPGVAKAGVVAVNDDARNITSHLLAYVVTRDASDRLPDVIRRHVANHVPSYMLPARILFMDELPMTATGKLDRAALGRLPVPPELVDTTAFEPPRDDSERKVAKIFGELLKVAHVGRDDDFFQLGGDSLLSAELQLRLSDAFGRHVGSFHQHATVAGIAHALNQPVAAGDGVGKAFPLLLPLWKQGASPPMYLVHGRNGQAFVSPHFMKLLGNDQPMWAFQARGLDGLQPPLATIEDMATHYLDALVKRQPRGPYFLASLCAGGFVAAVMARKLAAAGETVLPLLLFDPPDRLLGGEYARMPDADFAAEINDRRARGRYAGPVNDPAYLSHVRRVAVAFEQAVLNYQPQPYNGPVYLLSSPQRFAGTHPEHLRRFFGGRVERFEVGDNHAEAIDPRNPAFAHATQHCLKEIRQAARLHVASSRAAAPQAQSQR